MNKLFSLLGVLIMVISASGCVQQPPNYFRADFSNACDYPVRVTASRYSSSGSLAKRTKNGLLEQNLLWQTDNSSLANRTNDGLLEPGQTLNWVLDMSRDTCKIENAVLDDYKLEINANGKTISLDKASFLKVLKNAKSDHDAFTRIYLWTISDPKLCPQ